MSKMQVKGYHQAREGRLEIVGPLYKRGYTYRAIREEVMRRLGLATYSIGTVKNDIEYILKEWREQRLKDTDSLVALELQRIDDTCVELWSQWEKSKADWVSKDTARKGVPKNDGNGRQGSDIQTLVIQEHSSNERGLGDVTYIQEIRNQLAERRKILGLYAPERKDVTSGGGQIAVLSIDEVNAEIARINKLGL